ncbi:MAG: hypothetical protein JWL81_537 [Verrucomicrobiales bacterium]|nr:hypothetical protein [Verrucomicrobiales bacterium]
MQTRRSLLRLTCYFLLAAGAASGVIPAQAQLFKKPSALSREKGAFYIEDATDREVRVKTLTEAPVYSNLRGERRLGIIPAGRTVSIVAVSETALRVRGRAVHDNVVGWIARSAASPLDPKFMEQLRAATERRKAVDELIAKKQIAVGMTPEEVEAALGPPSERNSRVDAEGRRDTLEYVTYRTVSRQVIQYDQYGQPYYAFVPQKVETGRRSVDFVNGIVAGYTESERLRGRGNGRFVPPPIILDGGW